MSTTATGQKAEAAATEYLQSQGYKIIQRNWKTRICEIDIVAEKAKTIYFVEVKYRQSAKNGSGLEYITSQKLHQMAFAAEHWVSEHDWPGAYCLSAVAVAGDDFVVTDSIEQITD